MLQDKMERLCRAIYSRDDGWSEVLLPDLFDPHGLHCDCCNRLARWLKGSGRRSPGKPGGSATPW